VQTKKTIKCGVINRKSTPKSVN